MLPGTEKRATINEMNKKEGIKEAYRAEEGHVAGYAMRRLRLEGNGLVRDT